MTKKLDFKNQKHQGDFSTDEIEILAKASQKKTIMDTVKNFIKMIPYFGQFIS